MLGFPLSDLEHCLVNASNLSDIDTKRFGGYTLLEVIVEAYLLF